MIGLVKLWHVLTSNIDIGGWGRFGTYKSLFILLSSRFNILWPWLSEIEQKMCNMLEAVKWFLRLLEGPNRIYTWSKTQASKFNDLRILTLSRHRLTQRRSQMTEKVNFWAEIGSGGPFDWSNFSQIRLNSKVLFLRIIKICDMGKIHMFQTKNWNFGPFRSKSGPGGQLGRTNFSSKDAPEPIVSFAEIKKHVTWAKVTCSGPKTGILDLFGPKWDPEVN